MFSSKILTDSELLKELRKSVGPNPEFRGKFSPEPKFVIREDPLTNGLRIEAPGGVKVWVPLDLVEDLDRSDAIAMIEKKIREEESRLLTMASTSMKTLTPSMIEEAHRQIFGGRASKSIATALKEAAAGEAKAVGGSGDRPVTVSDEMGSW